jgi:hypothetical protein
VVAVYDRRGHDSTKHFIWQDRSEISRLYVIARDEEPLIARDTADLLQGLGAPIVSIGGAGTFDGIFMKGIIAVLLA